MIYEELFKRESQGRVIRAALIGTGHFGTAVIAQAKYIPGLEVSIVADINVAAAKKAYQSAGIPDEGIIVCNNQNEILKAMEAGNYVIVEDALLLMDLPIDVIAESTGVPEAGAFHAREAIRHGKHVAMITKEADATVGPILTHLAAKSSLVYTPVDGDQHGLLIGLVSWARQLGLEVLCGGKARDAEFVYDVTSGIVACGKHSVFLPQEGRSVVNPITAGNASPQLQARRQGLADLPQLGGFDITELVIAANATGLIPDTETTHHPIVHIKEIPEVLCPQEEGGVLQTRGVIDAVTCLRQAHEAGLGGGVFITVSCDNDYARMILATKGLIPNARGSSMLIYRPYHLCGVETPISILAAGLSGLSTGSREVLPNVDIVAKTLRAFKAGETIGNDHSPDLQALMLPAVPIHEGAPLPFHMANGNQLVQDVTAGTVITRAMVAEPMDSVLWSLRAEQDRQFL